MIIFNELDFLYKNLKDKKIAIIIPSKKILKNKNRQKIDSFDEVIRFNASPVMGYEEYVGTKTTLRVLNYSLYKNRYNYEYRKKFPAADFFYKKILDKNNLVFHNIRNKKKIIKLNLKHNYHFYSRNLLHEFFLFLIVQNFFPKYFFFYLRNNFFSKIKFSLGFFIINLFLYLKLDFEIFGLDLNENSSDRSHYYMKKSIGRFHCIDLEKKILNILHKNNKIILN